MAKHDRVTVRLRDGTHVRLTATRVGGSVEVSEPTDTDGSAKITERTSAGVPLRSRGVSASDVVAVITDRDGDDTLPELDEPRPRRRR